MHYCYKTEIMLESKIYLDMIFEAFYTGITVKFQFFGGVNDACTKTSEITVSEVFGIWNQGVEFAE